MIQLGYTYHCDNCRKMFRQAVYMLHPGTPIPYPERPNVILGQDLCDECCTSAAEAAQTALAGIVTTARMLS